MKRKSKVHLIKSGRTIHNNNNLNYSYWLTTYCGIEIDPRSEDTNITYHPRTTTCDNCLKNYK